MMMDCIKNFAQMSQTVGNRADYVQGGGGNTSAKITDNLMAIKASGYQLNQITQDDGFVTLDYKNIAGYYDSVDLTADIDFEKESSAFTQKNIFPLEGMKALRPSVEAGFHSILKKYVVHTHSVYANILTCAKEGKSIAGSILNPAGLGFLWIRYINPGFDLTVEIKKNIANFVAQNGSFPQVIFMVNHGLIVTADDAGEAVALHDKVNDLIRERLSLTGTYPAPAVAQIADGEYKSASPYIAEFVKKNAVGPSFFDQTVLYPDQLVYLNGSIKGDGKLTINTETGSVVYKANEKEARTIEETMLAYFFVIDNILRNNWEISTMTNEEIGFILNWDSEKYRKSLLETKK